MIETPRILLVEDDEDDYLLTRDLLAEVFGRTLRLDWVWTWEAALQALSSQQYDVYLVDYRLGEHDGLELVSTATALGCTAPMLMLTGQGTRETDLAAQATGAADYLIKSEITAPLLDRAIRYAIERKRVEMHLATLARFDSLTGLANRRLFQERLEAAVGQAERTGCLLAVLLIDLDHFKDINDTLGHPVGDVLLEQVASRLRSNVRQTDTVARLGGDEFAIIATNLAQADDAGILARKFIDALNQPFLVADHELFITSSIGVTLFPLDSKNSDYLLQNVDMALYQAKAEGRDSYRFYDTDMNRRAQTRKALATALRLALQNQDFYLQFQPKVAIASHRITGAEALLRWRHLERETQFPNEFIPLAESNGLIIP
jgi:diguanylate cyclase (GGDEF)-like protein